MSKSADIIRLFVDLENHYYAYMISCFWAIPNRI